MFRLNLRVRLVTSTRPAPDKQETPDARTCSSRRSDTAEVST
jgi:hypothetical protein